MKQKLVVILSSFFLAMQLNVNAKNNNTSKPDQLYLIENKGQVRDQNGQSRDDIQFSLQGKGINVFIGNGQIHYQFNKLKKSGAAALPVPADAGKPGASVETYRMDVELVGANTANVVAASEKQAYYENYYLTGCPLNGIHASAYKKITYKEVYPNIDWVVYVNDNNSLKHEFIVRAGGDAADIKVRYNGETSIKVNKDGSLTTVTPLGQVTEQAPVCYAGDVQIPSAFTLSGNTLSYNIGKYDGTLVIDPTLTWGTYYGPVLTSTFFTSVTYDYQGYPYSSGYTYSATSPAIATAGSFQDVSGGALDGFLVKFDSLGNRLWATYYGGSGDDIVYGMACDPTGKVYIGGQTTSTTGISTPGSFQPAKAGGPGATNSFLAKFDGSGNRIWGTYIGGTRANLYQCVSCDTLGSVYISGVTTDVAGIASSSGFQPTAGGARDCFLIKFDTAGHRSWGTYYGGTGDDFGAASSSDGRYIYISGYTNSTSGIATAGAYQTAIRGGGTDAFLAKFDSSGSRIWGTYYGGEGGELTGGLTCNGGFIYLLGSTGSDSNIASPGCYQPVRGGGNDAFLVRFDPITGRRLWATYYGGPGTEYLSYSRLVNDRSGNVCIAGYTDGTSGITDGCGPQVVYGGGPEDGFAAKFDSIGRQLWSTYYGGSAEDIIWGCALNGPSVYVCGYSNSTDSIATPGSFLNTGGGNPLYYQGFVGKIVDDGFLYTHSDTSFCVHSATAVIHLPAHTGRNYNWFDGDTASSHIIDSAGIYRVAYTFDCKRVIDTIHVFYNISDTPCSAGIAQQSKPASIDVNIFPDPAANECTISFSEKFHTASLTLYDIAGRVMRAYNLPTEQTVIPLTDIPAGMYQCKITINDNKMITKKLIIMK